MKDDEGLTWNIDRLVGQVAVLCELWTGFFAQNDSQCNEL